jgi:hypothetical protein
MTSHPASEAWSQSITRESGSLISQNFLAACLLQFEIRKQRHNKRQHQLWTRLSPIRHQPATMSNSTAVVKASDAEVVPVDPAQTLKACKALVAHIKKTAAQPREDGKKDLLADEESAIAETPIWLTLTTKKHIHDSHRMCWSSSSQRPSPRPSKLTQPVRPRSPTWQDRPPTPAQHRRRHQHLPDHRRSPAVLQEPRRR